MESSKVLGGTEDCSSSESGWTTYIASSIHGDDNCDDDHSTDKKGDDDSDNNNESDDSMASDASSGPSHPELLCECNEGNRVMGHFKHVKDEDHSKRSSGKKELGEKLYKQADKKIYGRKIKAEKEEPEFSTSYARRGAKLRKTN